MAAPPFPSTLGDLAGIIALLKIPILKNINFCESSSGFGAKQAESLKSSEGVLRGFRQAFQLRSLPQPG
jgi:hypothetical protein